MMNVNVLTMLAVVLGVTGCASSNSTLANSESSKMTTAEVRQGSEEISLTQISNTTLPNGKCGMILWTLEDEKPSAVFQYIDQENGRIAINGKELEIIRLTNSGQTAYGISETQSFKDKNGLWKLMVAARFGMEFKGGSYLERGLITVEGTNGWRSVTPVAGIAGCRRG